jgi:hypothetical protein
MHLRHHLNPANRRSQSRLNFGVGNRSRLQLQNRDHCAQIILGSVAQLFQ